MTIQPISTVSAALYLSRGDLLERGLCAGELTDEHTLELTREAFRLAGLSPERIAGLETFQEKDSLLIFIHMAPPRQTVWRFSQWESLLSAVALCETEEGALYQWDEAWWLTLPGQEKHAALLSEFADEQTGWEYILPILNEQGEVLLPCRAVPELKRYFNL